MLPFNQNFLTSILIVIIIVAVATEAAPTPSENDRNNMQLTENQKEKFELFKRKVMKQLPEADMKTDFYLLRWLRVAEFNLEEAESMLTENINWREENKMATILNEDASDLNTKYPFTTDTVDKFGRPIGTANIGVWDVEAGVEDDMLGFLRHVERFQEKLITQIFEARKSGKDVRTTLIMADLSGFSEEKLMCSSCTPVLLTFIDGLESHYPGFIEEIVIINAPSKFKEMMGAASALLSKRTRESIKLLEDKGEWMPYLDERISRDQRYMNFGGTKEYPRH